MAKKEAGHKRNSTPNTKRRRNEPLNIPLTFEQLVEVALKTPPLKKRKK